MTDSPHARLGRLIRQRRDELRLTQRELATRAGISERAMTTYESGFPRSRRPSTWTRLAPALGWDLSSYERVMNGDEPLLLSQRPRVTELPSPDHMRVLVHGQSDEDVDATLLQLAQLIQVVGQERSDRALSDRPIR